MARTIASLRFYNHLSQRLLQRQQQPSYKYASEGLETASSGRLSLLHLSQFVSLKNETDSLVVQNIVFLDYKGVIIRLPQQMENIRLRIVIYSGDNQIA
jgi:hypothetical protein